MKFSVLRVPTHFNIKSLVSFILSRAISPLCRQAITWCQFIPHMISVTKSPLVSHQLLLI